MGHGKPGAKVQAAWRDRLDRRSQSSLTDEEFAALEGVKPSSLKWWRWRLGNEPARGGIAVKSKARFVEVTRPAVDTGPMAGGACHLELVLRNGRVVRVPPQF